MNRRPWPVVVLAVCHFLEPLAKLGFYSLLWNLPMGGFLMYLQYQATLPEIFMFFGAFPLMGVAIFSMKKWSLPAFFTLQTLTLVGHIYFHLTAPKAFPLALILTVCVINLCVVTYFLLPAVRVAYLDPRVRWWESKPRYQVDWEGLLIQGKKKVPITISNISEGGLFASTASKTTLDVHTPLEARFEFLNHRFELGAAVRHHGSTASNARYGIEFVNVSKPQRALLVKCIKVLRTLDYPHNGAPDNAWDSFTEWVATLMKTGKGLVPEVNRPSKTSPRQKTVENTASLKRSA